MNRHVGPYHCAQPSQMPPERAPISKAPANRNDEFDQNDAAFRAGMVEYDARSAIRDLITLKGWEEGRAHVAMILNDLAEGIRQ